MQSNSRYFCTKLIRNYPKPVSQLGNNLTTIEPIVKQLNNLSHLDIRYLTEGEKDKQSNFFRPIHTNHRMQKQHF